MSIVSQNNVFLSLENALNSYTLKIDGRNEQDLMHFLAEFASILNLYDDSNKINGNWEPILLKDPVFLLAFISKTKYEQWQSLYLTRCLRIKQLIHHVAIDHVNFDESIPDALGQILHQVIEIFKQIERWTYYMDKSRYSYSLEDFIKREIKEELSTFFWALVTMRNHLILEEKITSFQTLDFKKYTYFNSDIWQEGKNKGPFWDILNLSTTKASGGKKTIQLVNDNLKILDAITKVGDLLFSFLKQVIDYANSEFETLKTQKSNFPDTTLIRTFLNLIQIHQDQLNTIAQKHLNLYYYAILKQQKKQAFPDRAFVYFDLSKQIETYHLEKGTEFNGGINANSKPILFKSIKPVVLESTVITDVYTLSKSDSDFININGNTKTIDAVNTSTTVLNLNQIQNTTTLQRDDANDVIGWETFGNDSLEPLIPSEMGFAFASPLLFLREGTRHVTITLTFNEEQTIDRFNNKTASFFFSTQKGWHKITQSSEPIIKVKTKYQTILYFVLDSTVPAIEAFKKNPDGVDSEWPMFKVIFNQFIGGLESAPIITELEIDVHVLDVKTFKLSNTKGPVNAKKPFPLFGVAPSYESSFYIGNSEIFSKPISSLDFKIVWNNLPPSRDFAIYYDAYNAYMRGDYNSVSVNHSTMAKVTKPKSAFDILCDWLNSSNSDKPIPPNIKISNELFWVEFMTLQGGDWNDFEMSLDQEEDLNEDLNEEKINPPPGETLLFESIKTTAISYNGKLQPPENLGKLSFSSNFSYVKDEGFEKLTHLTHLTNLCDLCDPTIQLTPLKYGTETNSGFIKMSLKNPIEGFGSAIYPQVISAIALVNAAQITNTSKGNVSLIKAPNPPFIPTVKSFTASYRASQKYTLDASKGCYPIQWFCYSPFLNYKTYDNSLEASSFVSNINPVLNQQSDESTTGIPLWPIFKSTGALFLGLQKKTKPSVVNLYFELAQDYSSSPNISNEDVVYSYMSESGWKTLEVKSDGTKKFNCSGILKIELPDDITDVSTTMPNGTYWLSISVNNSTKSYAKTMLLATNGIEVERSSTTYLTDTSAPRIEGNSIKKPINAIPQIAKVQQVFPSFGGKAAELTETANSRISTRLKTKDRVITAADVYGIVKQAFPSVFYCKTIYNGLEKTIKTYVLRSYNNQTDVNAFTPLLNSCSTIEIQEYLQKRASNVSTFSVSNFEMMPICVRANLILKNGSNLLEVEQKINNGIKLFLSPWIECNQEQIPVDSPISKAQITKFIKSFDEVLTIEKLSVKRASECGLVVIDELEANNQVIYPPNKSTLIISTKKHNITCNLNK